MNPAPETSPPDWTRQFTLGRFTLLLAALVFATYPEVVLGTHSFFYRDFGLFTYPVAFYTHESFWHGQVPLWNPLNNCGIPFLAQWNTTVCYPLSLVYMLLPLPWSLDYFCLGHLVLAGVAMYQLALRWTGNPFAASVAGLAFALNGVTLNCLMWTSNLAALAWMPFVILFAEQAWRQGGRKIVLAALTGALQMLAGAPEIILFTWVLLGTLWLGQVLGRTIPPKISLARLAGAFALVLALSAVQLLPFLELLRHSHRDVATTGLWAMPAWGWANFVVPLFRCQRTMLGVFFQDEQQWTSSYYPGIGVLALAIIAMLKLPAARRRWLAITALAGAVLALGDHAPAYTLLKHAIPLVSLARYPVKFVVLTLFALPLLAALAADFITRLPPEKIPGVKKCLLTTGIVLTLAMGVIVSVAIQFPRPLEPWPAVAENAAVRTLFLIAILAGMVWLGRTRRAWLGAGILILLGLDILTHAPRQNPTVLNEAYGPLNLGMSARPLPGEARAMISPLAQVYLASAGTADPAGHLIGLRRALYSDSNLPERIAKVNGFFSLSLRENNDVLNLIYTPTNFPAGLVDFLGAAQISDDENFFRWQPRASFHPLVTAGQQPVFAGDAETLRALAAPAFNSRRVVYLPPAARGNVTNAATANVTGLKFSAQEIGLEVEAAQPAWVVLAQSDYPGWRASVDGRPARLWRANHAFQALAVPAGRHAVRLVYRDSAFELGLAISAAALAGCGFGWFFHRRKETPLTASAPPS